MSNPATWVTTALTYMQGNMMEPWKEEQMTKLEACITGGVADTEEVHWTEFKQAFCRDLLLFIVAGTRR